MFGRFFHCGGAYTIFFTSSITGNTSMKKIPTMRKASRYVST